LLRVIFIPNEELLVYISFIFYFKSFLSPSSDLSDLTILLINYKRVYDFTGLLFFVLPAKDFCDNALLSPEFLELFSSVPKD
jgi:hypothetical protein